MGMEGCVGKLCGEGVMVDLVLMRRMGYAAVWQYCG